MPAFDNAQWIGARTVRPSDAQFAQIRQRDPAFYGVGLDNFLRHLGYFQQVLPLGVAIAGAAITNGMGVPQVIPCKIVAAQVGCETSASATSTTGNVHKAPAATPTVYATMSTGPVDIKTGAGTLQTLPVLDGAENVAAGDRLRLQVVSVGAGAVVGSFGVVHCFRL